MYMYKLRTCVGAIAGIVVASVLALLFLVFFIVALIVFILAWRKRRVDPGSSWFGDLKVVLTLGVSIYRP